MQQIPEMPDYVMFQSGPGESGGAIGVRGADSVAATATDCAAQSAKDSSS